MQGTGCEHPLVLNQNLQLVAWTVSGINCKQKDYRRKLRTLSSQQEGEVQQHITMPPGASGVAGIVEGKLIPFEVL